MKQRLSNVTVTVKLKKEKYFHNIILHEFHGCYVFFHTFNAFPEVDIEHTVYVYLNIHIFFISSKRGSICLYTAYFVYFSLKHLVV